MIFGKDQYFYHESIRNYTAIFGYLFSDLYVKNGDLFKKVMVKQVGGNMYETTQQNEESRDTKNVAMTLPAISYELINFVRSDDRKLNRNLNLNNFRVLNEDMPASKIQLNRMPYDFNFDLNVRTKTQDELLQIIEQIVGAFNPDITFKIKDNNDLELEQDIVVKLNDDIQKNDNYDSFNELQYKECAMNFTLKGYMYRRSVTCPVITSITLSAILGDAVENDVSWELKESGTPEILLPEPIPPKTTRRKAPNKPKPE